MLEYGGGIELNMFYTADFATLPRYGTDLIATELSVMSLGPLRRFLESLINERSFRDYLQAQAEC